MKARTGMALLVVGVLATGCDTSLDLVNPNAPTEAEVLNNLDGILALSLGMQEQYASSILTYVRAPALVTDEWSTRTAALAADQALVAGGAIDPSFGVVSAPYFATYRVARSANNILAAAPTLGLAPGLERGLTSTARLFKAMALGMAAMHYERLPIDASIEGAPIVPRAEVFAEVIRLLEAARADLQTVTDAELTTFRNRGLTPNFDLRNTVDAMLARYYLYTGQNQQALTAANRVNLSSVSVFTFPDPSRNPINNYAYGSPYVFPLRSFVTEAEPGDHRVPFWVDTTAAPQTGNPPVQVQAFQMFAGRNDVFHAYLPGEVMLIKAEAHARLGQLPEARTQINLVRTKSQVGTVPGAVGALPGAQLPALTAEQLPDLNSILRQIAYERRYELFSQGLRWEDLRRLGTQAGRQPRSAFLPLPESECRSNPNAGC
jgi:starch-binding outer membrane protein, SusD/RagB family